MIHLNLRNILLLFQVRQRKSLKKVLIARTFIEKPRALRNPIESGQIFANALFKKRLIALIRFGFYQQNKINYIS